jgi:hypothetical protein
MSPDGVISGTPATAVYQHDFTVTATDTVSGDTKDALVQITINKASQTLSAANIAKIAGGGDIDLSSHAASTAGANSGAITYAVTSTGATGASITGTTLSYSSAGTATITATAAGGANYYGATAPFMLTVSAAGTYSIEGTIRESGSPTTRIMNAKVELYDSGNTQIDSATSSLAGSYTFFGLASGTYTVKVPAGT